MPDDLKSPSAPPEYGAMRGALVARLNAVRRSIRVALAAEAAGAWRRRSSGSQR
jgi:hypothetical protein